ncbi:potassium channel family protein [Marinobacter sp. NSM]|uniref:potassium channel family protein n=1 Tax=Marinobacter sp. NSM TaxID=3458004 RepID=UPI0040360890
MLNREFRPLENTHDTLWNVTLLNTALVCIVVIIHNETLLRLSSLLGKMRKSHHFRLIVAVLGCLTAHAAEVWIFATAFYYMHHAEGWGELVGNFDGSLMTTVYFSFTTFTTLGYGDIEALGALRHLTGIEALTGFLLITWSASFLFLEMQRYWPTR